MSSLCLAFLLGNFIAIAALPFAAFRRDGRMTAGWLATAAPFFAAVAVLVAGALGVPALEAEPSLAPHRWLLDLAAMCATAASVALLASAARAHHIRPALWHQAPERDLPAEIVTWGPYSRVRHPFYSGFLLAFAAAAAALPNLVTAALYGYALAALTWTAAREERRLAASALGEAYRAYSARTGRFVPRLRTAG